MTKSPPPKTPRLNSTRLTETTCHRCRLPILTGWDNALMAQQVRLHPATITFTSAQAALHLGHPITQITGNHQTGFRANHTWHPTETERFTYTRTERTRTFMVWHQCDNLPHLPYQPIPAPTPAEPDTYDLFNQPDDDQPPY